MGSLDSLINGFGIIFETAKLVKDSAISAGFSEDEAFIFSRDVFNKLFDNALNRKGDNDNESD